MSDGGGQPAAVVFDCDGVIVDSEDLSWSAWVDVLGSHGYTPTPQDEAASLGRRLADLHAHFTDRVNLPPLEDFESAITEATLRRFAEDLEPFADAIGLLDELAASGARLAVASSSSLRRVSAALAATGVETGRFEAVVAGDQVEAGKPAPDIYLRAAELLGLPAAACWAIEDSPAGVASARAAGMRVIAILRGHVPRAELSDADVVAERLDGEDVRRILLP